MTDSIPKPLVKIASIPMLGHQINYLDKHGIKNIILATGYKSKKIENYVNDSFNHLNIKIVNSGIVDIMVRIYDCKPYLNDEFLVCYGDTLANINISELYNFHNSHSGKSTVSTYQLESQFGIIKSNNIGLVQDFLEKPKLDEWINIGYFIFNKSLINNKSINFTDFIEKLVVSENLYSYKHKGIHITVNTFKELKEAEKNINHFN
tara:strand:- start:20503 stop:21120 length:618 start_codon:yes stop_codon:yes gene_type:complete